MKRFVITLILALAFVTNSVQAQHSLFPGDGFSLAVNAGQYGLDTGVGLELGTPCVQSTSLYFRAKATLTWLEEYKAVHDQWANYKSMNVSVGYNVFSTERARVYVDLGTYVIFPNSKITSQKSVQGINSALGVELFLFSNSNLQACYYFTVGGGYAKAYADRLENRPRYGDGVLFNNGFRFYFCKQE